ncbi:MotA/TolQ/ExbB proton channel family protein [Telmatocola sphagniphila]|uniref:MotA/TolQ/ExbB proton channel family protein n=2 Tax=Telmatocola sphagniphila TaxID=1123043 RepID=A0A8E6BAN2_9BACT|nr:MotA/TolQ/ExbB proton channel family protein [Telmatocola sphagniphila]
MSVISGALLIPVLLAVLICLAGVLVLSGTFLRDWAIRARHQRPLKNLVLACDEPQLELSDVWKQLQSARNPLIAALIRGLPTRPASADVLRKRLSDLESDTADVIAKLSFLTRVSPMLGLLGTLIPLGPALTGLSSGNVQQLSSNLVVAFAATVVGLVTSCISYGIGLVRRSWASRDLDNLEYILNRLYPEKPDHA